MTKRKPVEIEEQPQVTIPKTLGGLVDRIYELGEKITQRNKEVQELTRQKTALEDYLKTQYAKADLNGAMGNKAMATLKPTTVARIEDWDALYAYIARTKAFDLLQRRTSDGAFRERWDAHKKIPGATPFQFDKLSITKRNK